MTMKTASNGIIHHEVVVVVRVVLFVEEVKEAEEAKETEAREEVKVVIVVRSLTEGRRPLPLKTKYEEIK